MRSDAQRKRCKNCKHLLQRHLLINDAPDGWQLWHEQTQGISVQDTVTICMLFLVWKNGKFTLIIHNILTEKKKNPPQWVDKNSAVVKKYTQWQINDSWKGQIKCSIIPSAWVSVLCIRSGGYYPVSSIMHPVHVSTQPHSSARGKRRKWRKDNQSSYFGDFLPSLIF